MSKMIHFLFIIILTIVNTKKLSIQELPESIDPLTEYQIKQFIKQYASYLMAAAKEYSTMDNQEDSNSDEEPFYKKWIEGNNYTFEEYTYETEDGYINSIWRIPKTKDEEKPHERPIILFHGLFDVSWTFFQQNVEKESLGLYLVDQGFDVWLPNNRGNSLSHLHKKYNSSDPLGPYWDFTLDDIALIDLPAAIEFVMEKTGKKVDFVGHSQGNTIFILNYLWNKTFLEENVLHFVPLGTVPNLKYNKSPYIRLLSLMDKEFIELYPLENVLVLPKKFHEMGVQFLETSPRIMEVFIDAIAGIVPSGRSDYKCKAKWIHYSPGGTSKKVLLQWLQFYKDKFLHKFDFGKEENLRRYGRETPPEYSLEGAKNWSKKMFYPFTDNDGFCYLEDLVEFYNLIQDKSVVKTFEIPGYNHMDITGGRDAPREVFPYVVDFLNNF